MRFRLIVPALAALLGALALDAPPVPAANPAPPGGKRGIDTMTVNLDVGADIMVLLELDPTDPDYQAKLVATVTQLYYQTLALKPPKRMDRVAAEIVARLPDVVSVQEASLIRHESPGDLRVDGAVDAQDVEFDYLQLLVDALEARGAHYAVASVSDELDTELPLLNLSTMTLDDIRLTDREAILVRTDLPPGQLRAANPLAGNFDNVISTLGIEVTRGWCSIDLQVRGQNLRCICTHLEIENSPELQQAQALELLAGPADVDVPVIVCGDFNSDPLDRDGSGALAHDAMITAGFSDAWVVAHPDDLAGGLTWGHDANLANPAVAFDRRIDFVFYRGPRFTAAAADVLTLPLATTVPPLWATDHAGVGASILFKK
jgi:endonuclease/exonuclease/phosphatase family metal-dependent hydrolase